MMMKIYWDMKLPCNDEGTYEILHILKCLTTVRTDICNTQEKEILLDLIISVL